MKPGTEEILALLKRRRSTHLTKQHFADLADDVVALGKDGFLDLIANTVTTPRPPRRNRNNGEVNPLLERMTRYRKQAGLSASDFNTALSKEFEKSMGSKPPKSALASAPKYLAYLQGSLSAADIEVGFAKVLAEYA